MTTWRDDIRTVTFGKRSLIGASFRGVPFFVETAESTGGRRAVVHEFPLRDEPFVEDLGRKARSFRIDGYVIGDDYVGQRVKLLEALEDKAGPGELVHPYRRGMVRAIATSVTVRESRADGGYAAFSIEFAETPLQPPAPVDVVDGPGIVSAAAKVAIAAVDAELVDAFDPAGLPAFALESAEAALVTASATLAAKLGPVISATQEAAAFAGKIEVITARAASLVRQPAAAITAFRDAITGLVDTIAAAPESVFDALVEVYSADLGPVVLATTATRARELANQTAIVGALRRALALEAARIVPSVPFTSTDDAIAAREVVSALLEEQEGTADDAAYPAIVDLRSKVLRAVPGANTFARVVEVTRLEPVSSILLAYQLYGSTDRELDVVARNKVRHPCFIAGTVKVLSDG